MPEAPPVTIAIFPASDMRYSFFKRLAQSRGVSCGASCGPMQGRTESPDALCRSCPRSPDRRLAIRAGRRFRAALNGPESAGTAAPQFFAQARVQLRILLGPQVAVQGLAYYFAGQALRHVLTILGGPGMGPRPHRPQEYPGEHQHRGDLRIDARLGVLGLREPLELRYELLPEGVIVGALGAQQLEQPHP